MGGIREKLCLQAKRMMGLQGNPTVGNDTFGETIRRIELHSRHIGKHQHHTSGGLVVYFRGFLPPRLACQNKVVVITVAFAQERVSSTNILPNGLGRSEVRRCSCDRSKLSCGN